MDVDGSESRSRKEDRKSNKSSNNTRDRSPLSKTARKAAPDRRVFVSNIPYEFRWQDLKDLFRDEGCLNLLVLVNATFMFCWFRFNCLVGEVAYVELFTDEKNKPRGCGIVEFDNADNVSLAIEKMHRFELKGRKLVVREVRLYVPNLIFNELQFQQESLILFWEYLRFLFIEFPFEGFYITD